MYQNIDCEAGWRNQFSERAKYLQSSITILSQKDKCDIVTRTYTHGNHHSFRYNLVCNPSGLYAAYIMSTTRFASASSFYIHSVTTVFMFTITLAAHSSHLKYPFSIPAIYLTSTRFPFLYPEGRIPYFDYVFMFIKDFWTPFFHWPLIYCQKRSLFFINFHKDPQIFVPSSCGLLQRSLYTTSG